MAMSVEDYKKNHLNKNLPDVHVTFVIDRSGSMSAIASDVVGGVNSFIKDQQKVPGNCKVTIWEFDSEEISKKIKDKDISEALYGDFRPRGLTPLFDAIGKAILDVDKRDKDEKQILVIMTDGHENASREFSKEQIVSLIKEREEKGWILSYLGANQDAWAVGIGMGFVGQGTQTYDFSPGGTRTAYANVSHAVANSRGTWNQGGTVDTRNFYDPDEQAKTVKHKDEDNSV